MSEQKIPFCPRVEMIDHTPVLIKSETGDHVSLESFLNNPTRTRLNETLTVFESYIEAVKARFHKDHATIYTKTVPAVKYNNFEFRGVANDCRQENQWRDDFLINWVGKFTVSARDWLMHDEKGFTQEEFALFLEKHINDVVAYENEKDVDYLGYPSKAELYNFVTTLEDSKGQKFSRKVNIQNGDVSVSLERESDDGTKQRLKMFERFAINLQLYEGFPVYRVTAKLRFRVNNGQVFFFYDIEGLEELFIENRNWAVGQIKEATGLPVFI